MRNFLLLSAVMIAAAGGLLCPVNVIAQSGEQAGSDRTLEEFKKYVAEKLQGLDDGQLDAIAKAVDADSNGTISESEFENRFDAINAIMNGGDSPDADAETEESKDEKPSAGIAQKVGKPYGPIKNRADVLIITNDDLAAAWKPFADWKTSTGRPAKIVSTEFIEENFSGDDIQQKIRACCLQHINEQQTKWVVLGGDSSGDAGVVPDRDTDHTECEMLSYADIPTDLYYISEKDWDANGDGRYGVFADDMEAVAYFNPNATIGRIPVRTAVDVAAYTDKVVAYESRYPIGDFAKRMVYTCPESGAYPKLETSISQVSGAWPSGYVSRFFGEQTAWDDAKPGDHELTPDNWIKMINSRQASKIHMHGHGVLELWVLEKNKTVKKSQVAELVNENAYPVITTVSCLTGQYDNKKDPCITESMLRQPKSGAIAILAPSREGVPFFKNRSDFRLMVTEGKMDGTTTAYTKFWHNALSEDITLGEAFRKVKMEMESDARDNDGFHMAQCELNLLGDPSLSARPAPPQNFKGRARMVDNVLKLRGIPNAQVCIWDGGENYMQKQANENGRLEVELPSSGTFQVTATAPGFNTWTSSVGESRND